MQTSNLIKKIKKAGLIGRGCNNFATATKWQMVKNAKAKKNKYVICNVSESEPGVFKDYHILKNWPEPVVEAIGLGMKTIKAKQGFIYLNPEYYQKFADKLQKIISNKNLNIELYQKPLHDYVGGEESAVINSMQGYRVEPNIKPPYPTTKGLFNEPTLINNCETFYMVSQIYHNQYKGERFCCLSGQGIKNKILKLPSGITIKKALQLMGHEPDKKFFYQVGGGASGTCYRHDQLKRPFHGLSAIIIYKKTKPEKELILNWAEFFKKESCGQCVPCREGTYRIHQMLTKYYLKKEKINQNLFQQLILSMQESSYCAVGKVATNAILSYWKNIKHKPVQFSENSKCE